MWKILKLKVVKMTKFIYENSAEVYDEQMYVQVDAEDAKKIFDKLFAYYVKNGTFGEAIQQCDNAIIGAPGLLADIVDDLFRFSTQKSE